MATKTYCLRTSNEVVIAAIAAYAKKHGIAESTAIGRMLAEGIIAIEGKSITRFAALDPNAVEIYSLALGEVRELSRILKLCDRALQRPRPLNPEDHRQWDADKKASRTAFIEVHNKMRRLKLAGKMEFMLHDISLPDVEGYYREAMQNKDAKRSAIFGSLIGKPAWQPPAPNGALPIPPVPAPAATTAKSTVPPT